MCKTADLFGMILVATFLFDTLVFTLDSGAQGSDKREVSPHPNPVVPSKKVYIHSVLLCKVLL